MADSINGYQLLQPWETSGGAQWTFAQKHGRKWFLKRFLSPKVKRTEDGIPLEAVAKAALRCEHFREEKALLYQRVREADTGNLIPVVDFFQSGTQFYAVSEKVDTLSLSPQNVARMSSKQKLILLKVLTHSLASLHGAGVVHADLKPDNVLIKKTLTGCTLKLIDFDAGFPAESPKRGQRIDFDPVFVAPETLLAMDDESIRLTAQIDIFALGLLAHLYWTGELPRLPEEADYAAHAVLAGETPVLDKSLPPWLWDLIRDMLSLDPTERPTAAAVFTALRTELYSPLRKGFRPPNNL